MFAAGTAIDFRCVNLREKIILLADVFHSEETLKTLRSCTLGVHMSHQVL